MNIVGGIKLPKSADASDLYIQCNEFASINYQEDDKKVVLIQGGMVSSNSYFNSFYEKFYTKYTILSSIYYVLKLKGDFKVSVYREVNGEKSRKIIVEQNFEKCQFSVPVKILPINLLQNENAGRIYFEIICSSEQGVFQEAWIATDENKAREVSLAITICTFRKEAYIKNTLTTIFQDKLLQNKDFKLFVVDNGRTLNEDDFTQPKLKLVPNINAGGSGGFTRGLVEALEENVYSHFLLMDDDIELESECIYRLFSLYEYANTDFAVAGGLLNLQEKHMLYEAGATYNEDSKTRGFAPGSLSAANNNIDLRSSSSLNKLLVEEHIDYGGFWFFSFSQEVVKEIKLPLPLFIKIDDIEFCLRIKDLGNKIVAFPSIAVWHQPASAKNLNWETYYYIRNDLITYTIHYSIEYMDTVQHFTKVILHSLSRFDYNHVEMVIKSFEDYIKGPDFIKNSEPEVLHLNIIKLSKSFNNQNKIDEVAGINLLTRWFQVAAKSSIKWSSVSREWKSASKEMTSTIFWQQYLGLKVKVNGNKLSSNPDSITIVLQEVMKADS